jgi:hypothetical protein
MLKQTLWNNPGYGFEWVVQFLDMRLKPVSHKPYSLARNG